MNRDLYKWCAVRYGPLMAILYLFNPGGPGLMWGIKEGVEEQFVVPPRLALKRIYLCFRLLFLFSCSFLSGGAAVALVVHAGAMTPEEEWWVWFTLLGGGGGGVLFMFISTETVRGKFHSFLGRLASSGEAGRAAGIAALVGKQDVRKVLSEARRAFMGVPFANMSEGLLATNDSSDLGTNAVAKRVDREYFRIRTHAPFCSKAFRHGVFESLF